MKKIRPHIGIYGSHDANIAVRVGSDQYRIYELERLTGVRNYRLNDRDPEEFSSVLRRVKEIIRDEYGFDGYSSLFYGQLSPEQVKVAAGIFDCNHTEEIAHHAAHAACAAFQSPFESCLCISSDGGGHELEEGVTCYALFIVDKSQPYNQQVKKIANIPFDVCHPYTMLAIPIKEIWKKDKMTDYLKYAGKLMGLAAYGKVRREWLDILRMYFLQPSTPLIVEQLGKKLGLDMSGIDTVSGQDAYDLAASAQYTFEQMTLSFVSDYIRKYNIPICLTGGGALNVLCNQKIKDTFSNLPVFVPCNPNDSGLAFGFLMLRDMPESGIADVHYSGFGILDIDELSDYAEMYGAKSAGEKEIARLLASGKIIGVMRDDSECGARALGNRSILAYAGFPDMKDRINVIKSREFYRPFAPLCKQEQASKFFCVEETFESPYMTYAPKRRVMLGGFGQNGDGFAKLHHKPDPISCVIHADDTARLQTVTHKQNPFLYNIINAVEIIAGTGMLLNTSLNIKSKPILTTIKDALEVLQSTDIDYMYIEGFLFENSKHKKSTNSSSIS